MTERRKSSRPAVIEKGRQLEEKLRSRETKKELINKSECVNAKWPQKRRIL